MPADSPKKIALITGTSSGIGLVIAIELARSGFYVLATMRDPAKSGNLMEAAREAGVEADIEVRALNIVQFDSLPAKMAELIAAHSRIDVLVNNAGYALGGF